jgi:hypothetical protein
VNRPLVRQILRIGWTVFFGVVAVALCVLWVRSYWWRDSVLYRPSGHGVFVVGSMRGKLVKYGIDSQDVTPRWERGSGRVVAGQYFWADEKQYQGVFGFTTKNVLGFQFLSAPHWFFVLTLATIAAVPWIRHFRWRFSLRTLLIITTLIAVLLGLLVYLTKAPTTPPLDVGDFDHGTPSEITR